MDVKHYNAREKLRNGQEIQMRAIRKSDKELLKDGFSHLSPASIYSRFHGAKKGLSKSELDFYTNVDLDRHYALVAMIEDKTTHLAVGVGRYICRNHEHPLRADIAFTIEDEFHGLGIGTLLMKHLTIIARHQGIAFFEADVLAHNSAMIRILHHCGLPYHEVIIHEETHFTLLLDPTQQLM